MWSEGSEKVPGVWSEGREKEVPVALVGGERTERPPKTASHHCMNQCTHDSINLCSLAAHCVTAEK